MGACAWLSAVCFTVLSGLAFLHSVAASLRIPRDASLRGVNKTTTFGDDDLDFPDINSTWRDNLLIVTSTGLVIAAVITGLYCCCRVCRGDPPTETQGQAALREGHPALSRSGSTRYPRSSFYAAPPRYSALVRSQSQRRRRLNQLERAAVNSLPRYSDAVKQLDDAEEAAAAQQDVLTPEQHAPDGVDTAIEVTETLLARSTSADNVTTTTAMTETLGRSTRPLFHSADSLLAAETTVALEDEIDSSVGPQMAVRSASCGDLLEIPENYQELLRKKVITARPDSLPPRYSEILEKSRPKQTPTSQQQ